MILYNFVNCPVFIEIKQTLHDKVAKEKISERRLYFMHFCLMFVTHFLHS